MDRLTVEELVTPIVDQFREFYKNTSLKNANLDTDDVKVFVRKSQRYYDGEIINCIDIASITIVYNKNRGRGVFTTLLKRLLEEYPNDNFYIESIVNPIVLFITNKFGFVTTLTSHPSSPDQILVRNKINLK